MRVIKNIAPVPHLSQADIVQIMQEFAKQNPDPQTELFYTNAYTLLIAVILSAQTKDETVNRVTKDLFISFDTPQKMLELGEEGLRRLIKNVGLYRSKALYIIKSSGIILRDYAAQVPDNFFDLCRLPGVGHKSARVVLNTWFGKPEIAVDTHVKRVAVRVGLADAADVISVHKQLTERIPDEFKVNSHQWLVLHGRYICKAKKIKCPICVINHICLYPHKTVNIN